MAWTELHDTLPDHPKVKHLAAELGSTKAHAIGIVTALWCSALRYGDSGEIKITYVRGLLADVGQTDVDGAMAALSMCGWVDPGSTDQTLMCHDWDSYAGRLELLREKDKERKRQERAELKRLREMSNGRRSDVQESPSESAQPNLTKQTQPTKPTTPRKRGKSAKVSPMDAPIPADLKSHEPAIRRWLSYKAERKEGYTPQGFNALMLICRKKGNRLADCIDYSMGSNWAGIYDAPESKTRAAADDYEDRLD